MSRRQQRNNKINARQGLALQVGKNLGTQSPIPNPQSPIPNPQSPF